MPTTPGWLSFAALTIILVLDRFRVAVVAGADGAQIVGGPG